MACGVPVVASNVGGLPEVITDGVSGFLHRPDDVDGMALSAIVLLSDPAAHERMAAEGTRIAVERFSANRIVPQYEALYERTLTSRASSSSP
jgi:glycosyltransferase involved in cell wall biosynthesis